jgi:hypothetical protein
VAHDALYHRVALGRTVATNGALAADRRNDATIATAFNRLMPFLAVLFMVVVWCMMGINNKRMFHLDQLTFFKIDFRLTALPEIRRHVEAFYQLQIGWRTDEGVLNMVSRHKSISSSGNSVEYLSFPCVVSTVCQSVSGAMEMDKCLNQMSTGDRKYILMMLNAGAGPYFTSHVSTTT